MSMGTLTWIFFAVLLYSEAIMLIESVSDWDTDHPGTSSKPSLMAECKASPPPPVSPHAAQTP